MGFNKDDDLSKNEELKAFFTPEFRNRLDDIVEFKSLDNQTLQGIVQKFINELNKELKKKKITVNISKKAIALIAKESYSKDMGARPIKRYIQENITSKLTDEILFGKLKNGGDVLVDAKGKIILKFKALVL